MNLVKSTNPGHHWNMYTYKPDGRPGYAIAYEGVVTQHRTMVGFSNDPLTARKRRVDIPGRFTAKNRQAAFTELFEMLKADGLIAENVECPPLN